MVTKSQAMSARLFTDSDGKRWRANGQCKVWKTRPDDFRLPIKFGLYGYAAITPSNAHLFTVREAW